MSRQATVLVIVRTALTRAYDAPQILTRQRCGRSRQQLLQIENLSARRCGAGRCARTLRGGYKRNRAHANWQRFTIPRVQHHSVSRGGLDWSRRQWLLFEISL